MSENVWDAVDHYYLDLFSASDPLLDRLLADSKAADLPDIQVSALQGKMLMLLAQGMGARRILEVGTLGGYSTVWLARALPADGRLVTLEFSPKHADVARANLANAGFSKQVEVQQGPAAESLDRMIAAKAAPFDFIFIDADKNNYPVYLKQALALSRPGSLIVADNVVWGGEVIDPASQDERVHGIRSFAQVVAKERRLSATAIQTVGEKGYDGFVLARVTG